MIVATGWLMLALLAICMVSGLVLGWFYLPSADSAHHSIVNLQILAPGGALFRSLHHYASQACLILGALHFVLVIVNKTSVPAVRRQWITGLLAVALLIVLAFSGRILPWDQHGGLSLSVAQHFFGANWLLGPEAHHLQRVLWLHLAGAGVLLLCLLYHVPLQREGALPRSTVILVPAGVVLLLAASLALEAPLGQSYAAQPVVTAGYRVEWYLSWLEFLAVQSTLLARLVLAGLCLFIAATPFVCRWTSVRLTRIAWSVIGAGLLLLSVLPR